MIGYTNSDLSGPSKSWSLSADSPYLYVPYVGDEVNGAITEVRIGAEVGAALFQKPFFASRDLSCAPALGSDGRPDLQWLGRTARFEPGGGAMAPDAVAAPDPKTGGYASLILFRKDLGPPPGVLLMYRRRTLGSKCRNPVHKIFYNRVFVPAPAAPKRLRCFNLDGEFEIEGSKTRRFRFLSSDRLALLVPADLSERYRAIRHRFTTTLFDGLGCTGNPLSFKSAARRPGTIKLDDFEFRNRTRSVRIDYQGGPLEPYLEPEDTVPAPAPAPAVAEAPSAPEPPAPVAALPEPVPEPAPEPEPEPEPDAAAVPEPVLEPKPEPKPEPEPDAAAVPEPVLEPKPEPEPVTEPVTEPETGAGPAPPPEPAPAVAPEAKALEPAPAPATQPRLPAIVWTKTAEPAPAAAQPAPAAAAPARPEPAPPEMPTVVPTVAPTVAPSVAPSVAPAPSPGAIQQAMPKLEPMLLPETQVPSALASQTFQYPVHEIYRLNYCLNLDKDCGAPAAQAWCQAQGFRRSSAWKIDENIGSLFPTIVLGTDRICAQFICDGFQEITCAN